MYLVAIFIHWLLLVLSLTVHEFAHAWTADHLGDPTPRLAGRLSLNPRNHIDVYGTVVLPLLTMISGIGLVFGWAKPVPFDPFNLRHPKRDAALIACAGPVSNLLLATLFALILHFLGSSSLTDSVSVYLLQQLIQLNVVLAVFNLIPVHPLDGFTVIAGLLPKHIYQEWIGLRRYGYLLLFLLIFPFFGTSALFNLISPIITAILSLLIPTPAGGII